MSKKINARWGVKVGTAFRSSFKLGDRVTGEAVRLTLKKLVRSKPSSANAWGSFIGSLVRRGALIDTGKTTAMRVPSSHGRRTPIYIVA